MTVKELIVELLEKPMDATVHISCLNRNEVTDLTIRPNEIMYGNEEIWVNNDSYDVYIKGVARTEEW